MNSKNQHEFEYEHHLQSYEVTQWPWWRQMGRSPLPYLAIFAIFGHWLVAIPLLVCLFVWGYLSLKTPKRRFQIRFKKWFRMETLEYPFQLKVGVGIIEIFDKNGKYFDSMTSDEIEEVRFYPTFICVDCRRIDTGMPETLELSEAQFPNENWDAVTNAFGSDVLGDFDEDANP